MAFQFNQSVYDIIVLRFLHLPSERFPYWNTQYGRKRFCSLKSLNPHTPLSFGNMFHLPSLMMYQLEGADKLIPMACRWKSYWVFISRLKGLTAWSSVDIEVCLDCIPKLDALKYIKGLKTTVIGLFHSTLWCVNMYLPINHFCCSAQHSKTSQHRTEIRTI